MFADALLLYYGITMLLPAFLLEQVSVWASPEESTLIPAVLFKPKIIVQEKLSNGVHST